MKDGERALRRAYDDAIGLGAQNGFGDVVGLARGKCATQGCEDAAALHRGHVSHPAEDKEQQQAKDKGEAGEQNTMLGCAFDAAGSGKTDNDVAFHFAFETRPIGNRFKAGQGFAGGLALQFDFRSAEESDLVMAFFAMS